VEGATMAAQPAERSDPYAGFRTNPSFDALGVVVDLWTADMAMELLPENNGPKVEVLRGSSGVRTSSSPISSCCGARAPGR